MQFPKGILFDFDGTLVDSESFHYRSVRDVLNREFSADISWDYYNEKLAGIPLSKSSPACIADLNLSITTPELVTMVDENTRMMYQKEGVALMPAALDAIHFFEDRGCALGIVTGSGKRDVLLTLERLELRDKFKVLVSHDDVANVKPHAEPYLKGIAGLGLAAEDIVAFEDSPNGMTSATNAGLTCIGIQRESILSQRMTHGAMLVKGFDDVLQYFKSLKK